MPITATYEVAADIFAAPSYSKPVTADELVAEAIRCIITGQEFPEALRAPSAISPGLASVQDRIAAILAGPRPC